MYCHQEHSNVCLGILMNSLSDVIKPTCPYHNNQQDQDTTHHARHVNCHEGQPSKINNVGKIPITTRKRFSENQ